VRKTQLLSMFDDFPGIGRSGGGDTKIHGNAPAAAAMAFVAVELHLPEPLVEQCRWPFTLQVGAHTPL
jgi:hypothetical protein